MDKRFLVAFFLSDLSSLIKHAVLCSFHLSAYPCINPWFLLLLFFRNILTTSGSFHLFLKSLKSSEKAPVFKCLASISEVKIWGLSKIFFNSWRSSYAFAMKYDHRNPPVIPSSSPISSQQFPHSLLLLLEPTKSHWCRPYVHRCGTTHWSMRNLPVATASKSDSSFPQRPLLITHFL